MSVIYKDLKITRKKFKKAKEEFGNLLYKIKILYLQYILVIING